MNSLYLYLCMFLPISIYSPPLSLFPLTLEVELVYNTLSPDLRLREKSLILILSLNIVNETNWNLLRLDPLLPT